MSSIVDVYLHGSVHLTNPGLEELLADTLSQGMSRSLLGPRGPADFNDAARNIWLIFESEFPGKRCISCESITNNGPSQNAEADLLRSSR